MPNLNSWSEERLDRAKWLWEHEGLTATEIAAAMGGFEHCDDGGRNAVIGVIHRRGWLRAAGPRYAPKAQILLSRQHKAERQARQASKRSDEDRGLTQTINTARKRLLDGSLTPAVIKEPPPTSEFLGLPFSEVAGTNLCRFPRGEGAAMLFCGQPALAEQSWCATCCRIVFQQPRVITEEDRQRRMLQMWRSHNLGPAAAYADLRSLEEPAA